jgi:hypothetical protein
MWSWLPRFEWILVELMVLAVLVWELVSIRRAVRRDRADKAAKQEPPNPGVS